MSIRLTQISKNYFQEYDKIGTIYSLGRKQVPLEKNGVPDLANDLFIPAGA